MIWNECGISVCPLSRFSGLSFRPRFERCRFLLFEQLALALNAPAVAAQFAVFADDAVAGRDECRRIRSASAGDGARGCGLADAACDLAVRSRLAIRYAAQFFPDSFLKRSALHVERQGRVRLLPGQMREQGF